MLCRRGYGKKSGRVAAGLIALFVAGGTVLALSDQREFAGREARMRGFLERMRELADGRFHVELVESEGAYDRSCRGCCSGIRMSAPFICPANWRGYVWRTPPICVGQARYGPCAMG